MFRALQAARNWRGTIYDKVLSGSISCFNNSPSSEFLYRNLSLGTSVDAIISTLVVIINFTAKSTAIIIAMVKAVRKYNRTRAFLLPFLYHLKILNANAIIIRVANTEVIALT